MALLLCVGVVSSTCVIGFGVATLSRPVSVGSKGNLASVLVIGRLLLLFHVSKNVRVELLVLHILSVSVPGYVHSFFLVRLVRVRLLGILPV